MTDCNWRGQLVAAVDAIRRGCASFGVVEHMRRAATVSPWLALGCASESLRTHRLFDRPVREADLHLFVDAVCAIPAPDADFERERKALLDEVTSRAVVEHRSIGRTQR